MQNKSSYASLEKDMQLGNRSTKKTKRGEVQKNVSIIWEQLF